jgi:DNA-binding MarR family transcriptional regulator
VTDTPPRDELVHLVMGDLSALLRAWTLVAPLRFVDTTLTNRQLRIMLNLRQRGRVPMHQVAAWLGARASSSTSFVDRLESRGLVERIRLDVDRRIIETGLTEGGQALVDRLLAAGAEGFETVLQALDESDLRELHRLIARLVEAVAETSAGLGDEGGAW